MAISSVNTSLNPEEKRFREYQTTGDDFTKIEIYRSAAAWYRKAIELRPDDKEVKRKLAETYDKIRKESKTIYIIVGVAVVILFLILIMR
jgi:hypothetical protein